MLSFSSLDNSMVDPKPGCEKRPAHASWIKAKGDVSLTTFIIDDDPAIR
jgi:hypothetical protein